VQQHFVDTGMTISGDVADAEAVMKATDTKRPL
jgi:20S proteasome alpha/beta subunit